MWLSGHMAKRFVSRLYVRVFLDLLPRSSRRLDESAIVLDRSQSLVSLEGSSSAVSARGHDAARDSAELPRMSVWRQLFSRRMLICVFTGFASGLPLYLLLTLVPAWLRSEQIDLRVIGFFALFQFPYNWKFVWAPFVDRFAFPIFGRRRGWM